MLIILRNIFMRVLIFNRGLDTFIIFPFGFLECVLASVHLYALLDSLETDKNGPHSL